MFKNFLKISSIILVTLLIVLLSLLILRALGYNFNKNHLSYDKEQCIQQKYDNGTSNDIESCVYWMRNNYLSKEQDWKKQFQIYSESKKLDCENIKYNDPDYDACSFPEFQSKMRKENLQYLTSKERDGIFEFCAEERCPNQPLLK